MSALSTVNGRGTNGARPAAGNPGRLYYDTTNSQLQRDNGSSWDAIEGGGFANPMTTAGDLIYGGASGVPTRLASAGTSAKWLRGANAAVPTWAYPPGWQFDYVEVTSSVSITGTSEGGATTVVTSNSVAYDGVTEVLIECYLPQVYGPNVAATDLVLILLEDSTVLGQIGVVRSESANRGVVPFGPGGRVRSPSNASHTYTVKAYVSGTSNAGGAGGGAGGSGNLVPGYIRVTKT